MTNILPSDCTATFTIEPFHEFQGLFNGVSGEATHPTLGKVATLSGYLIMKRDVWRQSGSFIRILDGESQEMKEFATQLFDNTSTVQPFLINEGYRSGTGCWGEELNDGNIIYLANFQVGKDVRKRGIGSWFLNEFLQSQTIKPLDQSLSDRPHIFCWPPAVDDSAPQYHKILGYVPDDAPKPQPLEEILSFYRKSGFRRLGRTSFFCYSWDENHPSRRISPQDDVDINLPQFESSATMSREDLYMRYPLHYTMTAVKGPEVANYIKSAYNQDAGNIHKPGPDGFTPLHLAVIAENVNAVRALVEFDVTEDLNNSINTDCRTPLEMIENAMQDSRNFMETLCHFWTNYSAELLTIEYLLKRAMHLPLLAQDETEYITKRKHGCSCGKCWEGWFSERMKFRLETTAIVQHDMLDEDITDFSKTGPGVHGFEIDNVMNLDMQYIPPALRPKVDHSLVIAWCMAFRVISDHLNASPPTPGLGLNPVINTSSQALRPVTKEFLRVGARIEYVLDALMSVAKEQSPFGDGTFEEDHAEMYDLLPQCSNDLAFDLVRHKIGLETSQRWAPYYEPKPLRQDAAFNDDDDDDDDEYEYDIDYD